MSGDDTKPQCSAKGAGAAVRRSRGDSYAMALLLNDLHDETMGPRPPACVGIPGEFVIKQLAPDADCLSCSHSQACKDALGGISEIVKAYSGCFGDSKKNDARTPGHCINCPVYRDCNDAIDACQIHGISIDIFRSAWRPEKGPSADRPIEASPAGTVEVSSKASEKRPSDPVVDTGSEPVYRFPDAQEAFREALQKARSSASDPGALLRELEELSQSTASYESIRSQFCALSIALNERRVFPPSLRHVRKIRAAPPGVKVSPGMSTMCNDLQVIDLHWAACSGYGATRGFFKKVPFPFHEASEFAAKEWRHGVKASDVGLSAREQRELLMINDRATKDWCRNVNVGRDHVEGAVRDALRNPRSKLPGKRATMMADAYVALRFAECSTSGAVRMFRLLTAREVSRNDLRKCKGWLLGRRLLKVKNGHSVTDA